MRRLAFIGVVLFLGSACSDDAGDSRPVQPASVAVELTVTIRQGDREWVTESSGWWDGELAAGAMTVDGEPSWYESNGFVTRTGVMVPDLYTPWTRFDLAEWGEIGYDNSEYYELGSAVEIWAAPSLESVMAIRELVDATAPSEGQTTVNLAGGDYLNALDAVLAKRALATCSDTIDIAVGVENGIITRLTFAANTGVLDRTVDASFSPWAGDLPAPPPEDEITQARFDREDEPRPGREPVVCHPDADPVLLARTECPSDEHGRGDFWFQILARHAETTPGAPARLALSFSRPFDLEEIRRDLERNEVELVGVGVQAPTSTGGFGARGIEVDEVPEQAELNSLVEAESGRSLTGDAAIDVVYLDGTWGDIARFASRCDINSAGPVNGSPTSVDLLDS